MPAKARRSRRPRRAAWRPRAEWVVLLVFACAVVAIWLGSRHAPPRPARAKPLTMAQARAINAAIPFVDGPLRAARPFYFKGSPAGREQAIQCLATAALYEAGDDPRAQKAVIQVVLNRVVLPHYPKTVCGVVYEGSGRPTGCQFSFTCDGSMTRRPEHAGWIAARAAAQRALAGHVFAPVGTATHYHADWMVPYWMPTLDKIAQIRTHIFYRPHHADEATAPR